MHNFFLTSVIAAGKIFHPLTLLLPVFRARMSARSESGPGLAANKPASSLKSSGSRENSSHPGWCLRTSSDFSIPKPDGISRSFSRRWPRSGILWRTEFWIVSSSEYPNDAVVCSLSEVLEKEAPPRFYLSPKAAAGTIRRAKRWGKKLPEALRADLEYIASYPALSPLVRTSSFRLSPTRSSNSRFADHPLILRRLTPIEYEMLHGFPKGWTVPDTAHWVMPLRYRLRTGLPS